MKKFYPLLQSLFLFAGLLAFLGTAEASDATECTTEEAVFHIECPPDTTVDCTAEIWDLSGYGWAYIYGYGQPEPAGPPVVNYNLNSCNIGTITRTWYAYDYSGNQYSCTQVITVVGGGNFNGNQINWPDDYHTYDCGGSLKPSDLPYPYNYPTFYGAGDCTKLLYSYDDLVFEINPPACIKILREWTVIDWCTYQPNNPYHHGGIWKHTQVLKVLTHDKPTINCPSDITASAGLQCNGAYVNIPPATGMGACGVDVEITHNSPYADSAGADASGFYPLGTTMVKFTARDLCGNKKYCKMFVTVKDMKKPTPICIHGVSSTLSLMQDGYYLDLQPKFFDKGSWDNCTPKHQLQFDVIPKRLDCDDLGENEVKLIVTDASGNSQFCTTYIDLQDNMGMCPPDTSTITLTGTVVNMAGEPMSDIQIVDTATDNQSLTDQSGQFDISIYGNNTVYLSPFEMNNGLQGVTVYDLILMQMNILGMYDFQDPVAALSADVNGNDEVSVSDIAQLKLQLLGDDSEMPMGYMGFVLVQDLSDEMIQKGLEEPKRWLTEDSIDEDTTNTAYFVGFPYGDIDASGSDGWNQTVLDDRTGRSYPVLIEEGGEHISFVAGRAINSLGMQMELKLPGIHWTKEDIHAGVLPVQSGYSLNSRGQQTVLTIAMPLQSEISVSEGDVLFSVSNEGSTEWIDRLEQQDYASSSLKPEMYSADLMVHAIDWRREQSPEQAFTVNVFPNPFEQKLSIDYYQPMHEGNVELMVSDMTGNVLYRTELNSDQGWHRHRINASGNWPVGMYMIHMKTSDDRIQTRAIKTE